MTEIGGYIDHIIYRKVETGYTVLEIEDDSGEEQVLTGYMASVTEGQYICARGEVVFHPSYGDQFKVQSFQIKAPEGRIAIERYLASGAVKGIGAALAKRIIKKFGDDAFRIMEEEPERLSEIKGISERMARAIAVQMNENKGMRKAEIFMQELGIGPNLAAKIYAAYNDTLIRVISDDPYRLIEDIQGIGFVTADEIAAKLGISPDSHSRIKSGILYTINDALTEGHIYLPLPILREKAVRLLYTGPGDVNEIDFCMDELIMEKKLIEKQSGDERRIYGAAGYFAELDCAVRLKALNLDLRADEEELKAAIERIEERSDIELDEGQREALILAAKSPVCIITGGPGTGKTTIIKMLLEYFDREGLDVMLAAPTGRAAKRMSEATGYAAKTIHRMLEINGEEALGFAKNDSDPLETDVVILDEMSMVDIFLFHAVLKAVTPGVRLIMVGDENQLPSVGPGAVLSELISSGAVAVASLDRIFRQAVKSDIVVNAHRINRGESIKMDNDSTDFFFLEKNDVNAVIEAIVYLVTKKLPPYVKCESSEIQVMTPMRKGALGAVSLNRSLQARLNPPGEGKKELTYGDLMLREGDKVMQVKNNYKTEWEVCTPRGVCIDNGTGVFNGDTGVVDKIDPVQGTVRIIFDDDRIVTYQTSMLEELELAYAITIHKSQGSEYPAVILPLTGGPSMLMTRNLLYTAVTRARSCVMVLGSRRVVEDMIANESEQKRYTSLSERINEL